jgi:hypothetical protein
MEVLHMDVSTATLAGVTRATYSTQAPADAAQILVLKKAIDLQAQGAQALLQALPQPALALATSGSLGTRLNTVA